MCAEEEENKDDNGLGCTGRILVTGVIDGQTSEWGRPKDIWEWWKWPVQITLEEQCGTPPGNHGSGSKPDFPVKYGEIRTQYITRTTRTRCLFLTLKLLH